MLHMNRRSALGWMLNSVAGAAIAQDTGKQVAASRPRPIDAPIDVLVPVPPSAFRADGKTHLVYEVHVTNFGRDECALMRLEVASLVSYSGNALTSLVTRPGPPAKDKLRIEAGLRAVIFVWVTLDSGTAVPTSLAHRLALKVGESPDEFVIECARILVHTEAIVISPPLRGSEWLAGNGPSNTSGHRRSLIPIGGGAHIAQRFAIDWLQLREDGNSYTGDRLDNINYRCYGQDALAVADAAVVAVKDGIPENVPGINSRAVPITLETVGGNHVILDLGGGRFGFYAHLQPGKIRVKIGDRVKHGQVIGLVGNSGNSTEPHLHFHVCDANSPLASEGLPYAFTSFEVQGQGIIENGHWAWKPFSAAAQHSNEKPLQNQVVRFS
jgi:murein DD-endopeptidase